MGGFDMWSANAKGALLMAAGRIAFVSNDAFMKFLFVDLSVFQAMFLRGLFAVPLIALIAWWHRCLFIRIGRLEFMLLVLRGGAQIGMASCFLLALSEMPIANVAAIMQALPLCLVMVAALCLGEMVGWRRWAAVVVGLFGVLMIIRPGTDAFSLYSLLALAAVGFATLNDAVTRYLPSRIPALFAAMFTAGAVFLFSGGMSIGDAWPTANEVNWPVVGLCAVTVAGGYLLQVMTMRQGDLSFVAPFRYVGLVWAIFLGVVLFAEWPDGWTLAGGGLVVAMGLYSFYADRNYGQRG
jgi:drug/metabolite transporter (DMT)-like permease